MNHLHHHTDGTDPAKLLQELDRDSKSRSLTGGWKTAMTVLFVLYSVTMIVMALVVSGATQYTRLPVFVGMTLFVGYLKYPASKRDALRDNYFPWYDVLLAFASLIVYGGGSTIAVNAADRFLNTLDELKAGPRLAPEQEPGV